MDLRAATRTILDSDEPADWLQLADMYIASFVAMPDSFVLPAQHAVLAPVVNAFYDNDVAFAEYVRALRDELPKGARRAAVHYVFRTINGRATQQVRRARMARALLVVEAMLGRKLEPDERKRVAAKLEQHWATRRREFLKAARGSTHKGRLTTDEQSALLKEFWDEIDAEIARRELPMFKV